MHRLLLVLCPAVLWLHPALENPPECANPVPVTQLEMNACEAGKLEKADDELNRAYQKLRAKLGTKGRARLRDAQRAWIDYRDKMCALAGMGAEGGSVQPMVVAICLARLTETQARELNTQLTCEEGDLSCAR